MTIVKAKYKSEDSNWVSLTFSDGSVGQVSTTDGIRRQYTDMYNDYVAKGGTVEPMHSLADLQAKKIQELEKSYSNANQLDIAYMNTTFQAGKKSQDLIVSVLSAGNVPSGFFWVDKTNNQVAMTYTDLQGLSSAILVRNQANFVHLQNLKGQVKAATAQAGLDAIIW